VTVSVGVGCAFPSDSEEPFSVIARADEALYMAKKSGRNRVCAPDSKLAAAKSS
jgi:diguanylate cyclase (GGDEF)-like protein